MQLKCNFLGVFVLWNYMNRLFTADEIEEINNITLKEIIMSVTDIQLEDLQDNVFFHLNGNMRLSLCNI